MNSLAFTISILIVVFARFSMAKRRCENLGDAVARGDLAGVKEVLKRCGRNTVAAPSESQYALHRAVQLDRPDIVFALLDRGVDPYRVDPHHGGVTALHLAANSTNAADAVETVTHLLLRNVDRMARDDRGRVPLHYAARRGSISAARLLLTACNLACRLAQLRSRESRGMMRPAEYAAGHGQPIMAAWLRRVVREWDEAEIMSMKNGLRDTYVKKKNCTNLTSMYSDLSKVRLLLRKCDIESLDTYNRSLLQYSCEMNSLDVLFTLLVNGADVRRGRGLYSNATPLVYACHYGHLDKREPVALLLLHEPDRSFQDMYGNTALHYAAHYRKASLARMLLSNCNASCKLKLLRVFNKQHKKAVDKTPKTDATMKSWLNEITLEAAEIRVQELQEKSKLSNRYASTNDKHNREGGEKESVKTSQQGNSLPARKALPHTTNRIQRLEARFENMSRRLDRLLAQKGANQNVSTSVPHTNLIKK